MIRVMGVDDIGQVAVLAQQQRKTYEQYEAQFWRVAEDATATHAEYLRRMLSDADVVLLVAEEDSDIAGFAVGRLVPAPPVYDPGGPSGIDDFVVADDATWTTVGRDLLTQAATALRARGAAQLVVVSGHRDEPKRAALASAGLSLASEWYVGAIDLAPADGEG